MSDSAEKISPRLLQELTDYARRRLADGEGRGLLESLGVTDPALIEAYRIGYLPDGFRGALPLAYRDALTDRRLRLGNSLILPATDEHGAIADLWVVRPGIGRGLRVQPQGLLGGSALLAEGEVRIVDTFARLAFHWKEGHNVLLLRGAEDARRNAARLYASGVRTASIQVWREGSEIADALKAAGIAADVLKAPKVLEEAPQTLPVASAPIFEAPTAQATALVFAGYDAKTEQATFNAGTAIYVLEVSAESDSKLELTLKQDAQIHRDRFDLASDAQRRRFATSAAMRTGIAFEQIEAHLIALLDQARDLQAKLRTPDVKAAPTPVLTPEERAETLTFLRRPDLLDAIAADMETLGWVGEDRTKRLLYLVSISRKCAQPLSAVLQATSGSGKSTGLEATTALTPAEDVIHVSRLTDSALYYHGPDALRHKLLAIDEFDALSPDVVVALRILQTRGALSQSHTHRDAFGRTSIQFSEARGPVAVLTSSAGKIEEQLLSRCIEVSVDESPAQTRRIVQAQLTQQMNVERVGAAGQRAAVIKRQHNLQRLLECKPVAIPFADRIDFPASSVKHRRTLEKVLGLIQASALLHQHQRLKQKNSSGEEVILADLHDFEIAASLAAEFVARATDELSRCGRDVMDLIRGAKLTDFDLSDLQRLKPEWTRYVFRAGLAELVGLEILYSPGRTRPRRYRLSASAAFSTTAATVRLRSNGESGDLAKIGETAFANTTPERAIG